MLKIITAYDYVYNMNDYDYTASNQTPLLFPIPTLLLVGSHIITPGVGVSVYVPGTITYK